MSIVLIQDFSGAGLSSGLQANNNALWWKKANTLVLGYRLNMITYLCTKWIYKKCKSNKNIDNPVYENSINVSPCSYSPLLHHLYNFIHPWLFLVSYIRSVLCWPFLPPALFEPAPPGGGPWQRYRGIWRSVGETTRTAPTETSCWPGPDHQLHVWIPAAPLPTEHRLQMVTISWQCSNTLLDITHWSYDAWCLPAWQLCYRPVWSHCPVRSLQCRRTPLRSSAAWLCTYRSLSCPWQQFPWHRHLCI